MAIYVTGDTHSNWIERLGSVNFPQGRELTENDYVVVLGDFGIWANDAQQNWELDWLTFKPWTTLFIDGNHENFDWLYTFPEMDWNGGKVHQIRKNVFHLMRGYVFDLDGYKCFAFGGAASHDIKDGIFEIDDPQIKVMRQQWGKLFRINHLSWWKEEMPSFEEYQTGLNSLEDCGYDVDFVFTHEYTAGWNAARYGEKPDALQLFLQQIQEKLHYNKWFFGHHHIDEPIYWDHAQAMYTDIVQIG